MSVQQWEWIAQDRLRDWEKELKRQQLLADIPQPSARWQRWTGSMLVRLGVWLMRWGDRLTRRRCHECMPVAG